LLYIYQAWLVYHLGYNQFLRSAQPGHSCINMYTCSEFNESCAVNQHTAWYSSPIHIHDVRFG